MAGWIKVRKDLTLQAAIVRAARILAERDAIAGAPIKPHALHVATCAGAVCILWITADEHIDQNDILPLGPADIDQLTGVQGFCELLPAQWLQVIDANRVKLPNFQAHNGTVALRRAVGAERQARYRNALASRKHNGGVTRPSRVTREK